MITSGAVSALLLHPHRRVTPRHAQPDDFAGALPGQRPWPVPQATFERSLPSALSVIGFAMTNDFVNDARNRCGGVDYHSVLRNIFFRLMPSRDEFPFSRNPAAPFTVRSCVKPPIQCVKVDFKDKDAVEQVQKLREVP